MKSNTPPAQLRLILVWGIFVGILISSSGLALAGGLPEQVPSTPPPPALEAYQGPEACSSCHSRAYNAWATGRHAGAFSSPSFQQNWQENANQTFCLSCHATGFDAATSQYAHEEVTCEACHGPWQQGHPETKMSVQPTAELCATCHKTTTDEWKISPHGRINIQCQSCHDPHQQNLLAESVNELCINCHKNQEDSFTHSTHAQADVQCANCHMTSSQRTDLPVQGLAATGHLFTVSSEACLSCHHDTIHSRDQIVSLSGQVTELEAHSPQELRQTVTEQETQIKTLQTQSTTRLYVGLVQGAVVGLAVGAAAAWIVSKRLTFDETVVSDE